MHTTTRGGRSARLVCEPLEDRVTPVVAYALSGAGLGVANLLAFDTASPGLTTTLAVTNINAGDTLVGIDFRPQNGHLYGVGVSAAGAGTLYDISTRTGRATPVGAVGSITPTAAFPNPATAGTGFGVDFNPTVDRLRIVTTNGQSVAVDPNTGVVTSNAPTINGGAAASADAVAYTNSAPNATTTTLFAIDASGAADTLYTLNTGTSTLTAVGALGVNAAVVNGFDLTPTNGAFAALTVGAQTALYTINTTTGAATFVGVIGTGGAALSGFAVQDDLGGLPAIGLDSTAVNTASLLRFSTANPGAAPTAVALTGAFAASGEFMVAIDFRPQTGQLYGLGVNAGTGDGTLYLIDPQTGATTVVGATGSVNIATNLPDPGVATTGYGFDFNPSADAIRVVTNLGQNFRVSPVTGAVLGTDTNLGGGATGGTGTAYTNSFGQAAGVGNPVTQYTLDPATDALFIQVPPNSGALTAGQPVTLNGAQLNFTAVNGFDIPAGVRVAANGAVATGFGYASLVVGGTASLYRINLATGAATNLGALSGNPSLDGLTLADVTGGTVAFQSATASGAEGSGVNVVLSRTSGSGPQTVTVTVTGGTATQGTDFTAGPYTVTFVDGATTATLNIPVPSDGVAEQPETITLAITAVPGGALGAQNTTTVTVADSAQPFGQVFGTGSAIPAVATPGSGGTFNVAFPYGTTAVGGVRVATGDVNNDGFLDLVTVPSVGAPFVKVFSGADGSQLASFFAYPATINIPASLAVGDLNNDGFADIVLGTNTTLAAVIIIDGRTFIQTGVFLPFDSLPVGINVAVGDTDGDGRLDIIVGTATGLAAIAYYDGQTFAQKQVFLPFGTFFGGVTVAAGDFDGDNQDEVVVGTASVVPAVAVFSGVAQQRIFLPFGAGLTSGVNVAAGDVNGDGVPDIIAGLATGLSVAGAFDATSLSLISNVLPFGGFLGGIFVG